MTLKQLLKRAVTLLDFQNIDDAPLVAEVLLRHVLNLSRVQLFQQLESEITSGQSDAFLELIGRRISGEPVAYITGHKEFYGLDFTVDSRVLIPRPETEMLVDKALEIAQSNKIKTIADIGTGSGAIAVAIALNLPRVKIYASDISATALDIAAANIQKHGVSDRITLIHGDLLEGLPGPVDLIIANLPYVKESDMDEPSISCEPRLALEGGADGLNIIRRFILAVGLYLNPSGNLLMEIGKGQSRAVKSLLIVRFPLSDIKVFKDYNHINRVVLLDIDK